MAKIVKLFYAFCYLSITRRNVTIDTKYISELYHNRLLLIILKTFRMYVNTINYNCLHR